MKIGRYEVKLGGTTWVQTQIPTEVKSLLGFIWIFRKANIYDVDSKPRFPLGLSFTQNGRTYRYYKAHTNLRKEELIKDET